MKKRHEKLTEYYLRGDHIFIASDEKSQVEDVLDELEHLLKDSVSISIDCAEISTPYEFAESLTHHTNAVLEAFGAQTVANEQRPGACLQVLNDLLADHKNQGYLLLSNVDDVISGQYSFEVEASLREVMQFRSDVAVLIAGTKATLIKMHQSDRPFYLSFRIFWLDENGNK